MSKKRPTESSWDSDEELLSDTSGITAFPKAAEVDLIGDDGEIDEDALLGMDDSGAKSVSVSFTNDSARPVVTRHAHYTRSREPVAIASDEVVVDEQAFVFDTDTADLEDELGGVEEDASYTMSAQGDHTDHIESYAEAGDYSEASSFTTGYGDSMVQPTADFSQDSLTDPNGSHVLYMEPQSESYGDEGAAYVEDPSLSADETGTAESVVHEEEHLDTAVDLGYDHPETHEEQVHLEYGDPGDSHHDETATEDGDREVQYQSDSDSDDDSSRHNRGKFTTERTGVISLTDVAKRPSIPDTLEIDEEQAAQIEQFMTDKGGKAGGRGGKSNVHSRLGLKGNQFQGPPQRGGLRGGLGGPRMMGPPGRLMMQPPRFPDGPFRGPIPGGMGNPRMFPPGPMNPLRALANTLLQQRGLMPGGPGMRPRFDGPRGPFPPGGPMLGPHNMRGPMPQDLIRMRMQEQGGMRPPGGPGIMGPPPPFGQRGPGMMMRLGGPRMPPGMSPDMRGPRPLMDPGPMQRMNRPPDAGMRMQGPPNMSPPGLMGPPQMRGVIRTEQGLMTRKNKIFVNPRFQGAQPGATPSGITRTVKIGVPLHQRKAKAIVERARQVQLRQVQTGQGSNEDKQGESPSVGSKRRSTGGDELPTKVIKKESNLGSQETNLLEEQKKKRELIQKQKELARQRLAEQKRRELEKKLKSEGKTLEDEKSSSSEGGQPIQTLVRQTSGTIPSSLQSRLGPPPKAATGPSGQTQVTQRPQGPPGFQMSNQTIQIRGPPMSGPVFRQQIGPRGLRPGLPQRPGAPQTAPGQFRSPQGVDLRFRGPPPQQNQQRPMMHMGQQHQMGPRQGPPVSSAAQFQPQRPGAPQRMRPPMLQSVSPRQLMGPPPTQPASLQQRLGPSPIRQTLNQPPPRSMAPAQQRIGPSPPIQQRSGPRPQSAPMRMGPPPSAQQRLGPPPQSAPAQPRMGPPPSNSVHQRIGAPPSSQPSIVLQTSRPPPPIQQGIRHPPPGFSVSQASVVQPTISYSVPPPQMPRPAAPRPTVYYPPATVEVHTQPPAQPGQYTSQAYTAQTAQSTHYGAQHIAAPQVGYYSQPPPTATQYAPATTSVAYSADPYQQTASYYQHSSAADPYSQSTSQTHYEHPTSQSSTGYQHSEYQYDYSQQPIQAIGSLSSQSQQDSNVGQRIQTISARAQPTSGSQIRSIIRNVATGSRPARAVQSANTHFNRTVLDGGQVPVLDGPQRVLILNVPELATRETLLKICKHFGRVLGVHLTREQNKAVVQFERGEEAAKCVSKCNQKCLHKTRITVKLLPN